MGSPEGTLDTSLHQAVRLGDVTEVRTALKQGHDPNLIGLYQWSALHEAAHNGEVEILDLLLECQGDPNKRDQLKGDTAVHYAAREGHRRCLEMLLGAGGSYSVYNNDGQNCLDVADPVCRCMLQEQQAKDLMYLTKDEAKELVLGRGDPNVHRLSDKSVSESDTDSIVSREEKPPALGYIHLSFEYNSRTSVLRIRVWQISDLLLPPPQTSMISSIYVKSYLMPDKKKDSKRKTDDVKVESSEAHFLPKRGKSKGIHHIFTPSTFKFSKPLEYSNISNHTISEKTIQVEVCLTQKYSKRSFMIGMFYIPMKEAIKKLVKDKYPLIPCMNHTIPKNMRVFSASELQIISSPKIFYSNPNIRSMSMSTVSDPSERAASDIDLKGELLQGGTTSSVSILLSDDDDCCVELGTDNENLSVLPGSLTTDDDHSIQAQVHKKVESDCTFCPANTVDSKANSEQTQSISHTAIPMLEKKKKVLPSAEDVEITLQSQEHVPTEVIDWKYQNIKLSPKGHSSNVDVIMEMHSRSGSRPNTPTWDYYDLEAPCAETSLVLSADSNTVGHIPMETKMEVHEKGKSSFHGTKVKNILGHTSGPKSLKHYPGKAVPQIVITAPVKEVRVDVHEPESEERTIDHDRERSTKVCIAKSVLATPIPPKRKRKGHVKEKNVKNTMEMSTYSNVVVIDSETKSCPNLVSKSPQIHVLDSDICVIDLTDDDNLSTNSTSVTVDIDANHVTHSDDFRIPQQVFIDDMPSSDSGDDLINNFDQMNPFLIPDIEHPNR